MELKKVKAKCGCEGCYYEDEDECPGDNEPKLGACCDNGEHMIFVKGEDNGTRV